MSHSKKIKKKHYPVYRQIAMNIHYFRRTNGLFKEQLAEKADVSVSYLSAIESPGSMKGLSFEILLDIPDALEVSIADLVRKLN